MSDAAHQAGVKPCNLKIHFGRAGLVAMRPDTSGPTPVSPNVSGAILVFVETEADCLDATLVIVREERNAAALVVFEREGDRGPVESVQGAMGESGLGTEGDTSETITSSPHSTSLSVSLNAVGGGSVLEAIQSDVNDEEGIIKAYGSLRIRMTLRATDACGCIVTRTVTWGVR